LKQEEKRKAMEREAAEAAEDAAYEEAERQRILAVTAAKV
jgi:hypothetical protein